MWNKVCYVFLIKLDAMIRPINIFSTNKFLYIYFNLFQFLILYKKQRMC